MTDAREAVAKAGNPVDPSPGIYLMSQLVTEYLEEGLP